MTDFHTTVTERRIARVAPHPGQALGPSPSLAAEGILHGAAFVLLCLWTRTSPDRLRSALSPEGGACATLGY